MVGADEGTVTTHGGDLAHLGHGRQATSQLADNLFFVATQLVDIDYRPTEFDAEVTQVRNLVHHRRHMQQRFGGDAADIQADATQLRVAFDDDDLQAQVRRAECG